MIHLFVIINLTTTHICIFLRTNFKFENDDDDDNDDGDGDSDGDDI